MCCKSFIASSEPSQPIDQPGPPQLHHGGDRVVRGDLGQDVQGGVLVVLVAQDVGGQQAGGGEIGPQIERQTQHDHGEIIRLLRAEQGREGEIGLRDAVRSRSRTGRLVTLASRPGMAIDRSGAISGSCAARVCCASAGWPERACQLARIWDRRRFGSLMLVSAMR